MGINKEDKDKALEAAMLQIQKQFGKGAIMKLGSDEVNMSVGGYPDRIRQSRYRDRYRRYSPGKDYRDLRTGILW